MYKLTSSERQIADNEKELGSKLAVWRYNQSYPYARISIYFSQKLYQYIIAAATT